MTHPHVLKRNIVDAENKQWIFPCQIEEQLASCSLKIACGSIWDLLRRNLYSFQFYFAQLDLAGWYMQGTFMSIYI